MFGNERRDPPEQTPSELIEACLQERREALVQIKAPWREWAAQLREICLQGVASKSVDGRKMQARFFEPWFEKISAWAEDESVEQLDIGTGFTRLTPEGMSEAWKGAAPDHPGLDAMAGLKASLDALPSPDAAVLQLSLIHI